MWTPLVEYKRNGLTEIVIHGSISWMTRNHEVYSLGDENLFYGRSLIKPIQLKVIADDLDSLFDSKEKALSVSSHNAEPCHVETLKGMLSRDEFDLIQTPRTLPLVQFGKQLRRPRRWYHSCSGKHAAILKACYKKGWDRAGYVLPYHEFHKEYLKTLKTYLGHNHNASYTAKDGCGMPTLSFSLKEMAQLFSFLVYEKDHDWIWDSMVKHPDLVGGFNRLDTTILKSCGGKVLAKEGADGLLGLSIEHDEYPEGLGIVIKLSHGWDMQAMWYIACTILKCLGFKIRNPYPLERQKAFVHKEVVPEDFRSLISKEAISDPWDCDHDRWSFYENNLR